MTKDLAGLTDEQLKAELKRREDAAKPKCPAPKAFEEVDFKAVYDLALWQVAEAKKLSYLDEDDVQFMYEAAMESVYGPEIWAWMRGLE